MNKHIPFTALIGVLCTASILMQGCSGTKQMATDTEQPQTIETTVPLEDTYRIRTGDEIEILVWAQPNFNTVTSVSRLGTIAIPLAGELKVTGLTKDELQRELERMLSEYIKGDIGLTISIRNTDGLMVSVFGMVTRPDNYPVVDQTSIFRVLSTAGGPTTDANLKNVKVYRSQIGDPAETIDLTSYLEHGEMNAEEVMVYPGDIIYVAQKDNVVRNMSEFLRDVVILFGIFRVFN